MNIHTNHPQTSKLYTQNPANKPADAKPAAADAAKPEDAPIGEKVELSKLDALRSQPEIRPEVVAKGKELLNDPNYPSKEIVDSIAKLIVPFDDEE